MVFPVGWSYFFRQDVAVAAAVEQGVNRSGIGPDGTGHLGAALAGLVVERGRAIGTRAIADPHGPFSS